MVQLAYENEDVALVGRFVERGYRTIPSLWVNGQALTPSQCAQARPNQTLLNFLRSIGLTGTKLGCGEGGCGACTVVISRRTNNKKMVHQSVNACLFPILAADGMHITTVEGIGSWKAGAKSWDQDNLHPIQRAMVDMHGSQCGFCTPGIIMAIYGLFASNTEDRLNIKHLEEHLDGNLCRCTGYRPIWDAARSLCDDQEEVGASGPCGVKCRECPERESCEMDCNVEEKKQEGGCRGGLCGGVVHSCTESKVMEFKQVVDETYGEWWKRPDESFPNELTSAQNEPLLVVDTSVHSGGTWFQPHTLEELLDLFREFAPQEGGLKLVVGNTEVGIETKFKHAVFPRLVRPMESVHTLYEVVETDTHFYVGACSSLSSLQSFCHKRMADKKSMKVAAPIHDMLRWFASTQIRNVACLGGNLATASPISDMNPMLAAMGATIVLASRPRSDGGIDRRTIPVKDFFLGYRTVDKKEIEVIERVEIPLAGKFEYIAPFKQARRREDDISIVTSGMKMKLRPEGSSWIIDDISIAFGGMAPKTVMASKTMEALAGKTFEDSSFTEARAVMQNEFRMPEDVPGGQAEYRLTLACSFLHKFYLHCVNELKKEVESSDVGSLPPVLVIDNEEESAVAGFLSAQKPSIGGTQSFPEPKVATGLEESHFAGDNDKVPKVSEAAKESTKMDSVGRPVTHASGPLHCTGEASYADDIPAPENLLHGSLILASKCHALLESIDITPALKIPGVFGVFTHQDIEKLGGDNRMGPILLDDVTFLPIGEKVDFVGQVLGIVVGLSQEIAEKGARAVNVQYSEEFEGNPIVSIEDAIKAESFWTDFRHEMKRGGDVNKILSQTEVDGKELVVVEGSIRSGGQEHFYLEPNSTLAIPSESGTNLTIYASTQAPTKTQDFCARVTNTPAARVVVRMKRMGGGFGGKETRSVFSSVAAAVAAKISNRPVRLTLNRDTDMSITGGRHAFVTYYKAGAIVEDDGSVKLHALDVKLFNNGGAKFDLTGPVMDRALFHVDNCYNWPNFHSVGTPCKTSQPPHTAFRGFGGPQGMVITEHIMDHLAIKCDISGDKLRRDNMYTMQDCTPFGMRFGDGFTGKWNVPTIFDELFTKLDVPGRRAAAAEFNAKNKWKKRGVALTPTKFGIAFTAKYMNQGGALVHLYTDGTVLISHGGTEMGQGLHTKVCQVAAQAFGIPLDDVYVNDSSTDKVANTIPSAASMSTDLYGMATLDACKQILKRIQPIRDSLPPNAKLCEVAKKAFFERVDLSAHGFFAVDNNRCGYDWAKERPEGFPIDQPENSWKGHPFNYFTQGVAFAEVEIDVLTGDHKTIHADVVVDVGSSINPAIDIGQIEGAFIQGMGWSTIEEVVYSDDDHTWIRPRAKVFTTGPGTYKIPAFNDVPEKFNVSLMQNADNPFAVHSSKAVGEPPFFLGCSVFFAIKDAVTSARNKKGEYFEFRMPATSERIRMACNDEIASQCIAKESSGSFQPKGSF